MKRKNKFAIGFWITSTISVALAVALVAVIAAFTTTASSGFHIVYEAGANVEATISGQYKHTTFDDYATTGYTTIYAKGSTTDTTLNFSTDDEDEDVKKEFESISKIDLEKDNCVIIRYTIQNDSSLNSLVLNVSTQAVDGGTIENVKIEYASSNTATTEWEETLNNVEINQGASLDVYVRVSVDVKTQRAEFNGLFLFSLDAVD